MASPESHDSAPPSSLTEHPPSSFDDNFFEEKRLGKLWRRLKEEPLIPIGCAATCYALYQATKSIRQGDHHQTNRMFRARIYAQGFTLVALVAGSIFYKDDRLKRKAFESALEDKKAVEKREKWLAELETRDKEDREWRERFENISQKAKDAELDARETMDRGLSMAEDQGEKAKAGAKGILNKAFPNKSVREQVEEQGWGPGSWILRTGEAWRRR